MTEAKIHRYCKECLKLGDTQIGDYTTINPKGNGTKILCEEHFSKWIADRKKRGFSDIGYYLFKDRIITRIRPLGGPLKGWEFVDRYKAGYVGK